MRFQLLLVLLLASVAFAAMFQDLSKEEYDARFNELNVEYESFVKKRDEALKKAETDFEALEEYDRYRAEVARIEDAIRALKMKAGVITTEEPVKEAAAFTSTTTAAPIEAPSTEEVLEVFTEAPEKTREPLPETTEPVWIVSTESPIDKTTSEIIFFPPVETKTTPASETEQETATTPRTTEAVEETTKGVEEPAVQEVTEQPFTTEAPSEETTEKPFVPEVEETEPAKVDPLQPTLSLEQVQAELTYKKLLSYVPEEYKDFFLNLPLRDFKYVPLAFVSLQVEFFGGEEQREQLNAIIRSQFGRDPLFRSFQEVSHDFFHGQIHKWESLKSSTKQSIFQLLNGITKFYLSQQFAHRVHPWRREQFRLLYTRKYLNTVIAFSEDMEAQEDLAEKWPNLGNYFNSDLYKACVQRHRKILEDLESFVKRVVSFRGSKTPVDGEPLPNLIIDAVELSDERADKVNAVQIKLFKHVIDNINKVPSFDNEN